MQSIVSATAGAICQGVYKDKHVAKPKSCDFWYWNWPWYIQYFTFVFCHWLSLGRPCSWVGGIYLFHWRIQGAPPQQDPILSFSHVFAEKHTCQRSVPPQQVGAPLRKILDPPLYSSSNCCNFQFLLFHSAEYFVRQCHSAGCYCAKNLKK